MPSTTKVKFLIKPPSLKGLISNTPFQADYLFVLFYDKKLIDLPGFKNFKKAFRYSYSLKAGESLKTVQSYESLVKKILQQLPSQNRQKIVFVSAGGGSVGDFIGFVASTFKRGVNWVNIPTTWLAAIDSAHGGKTALNLGEFKNQIGSFYPAKAVFVCKPWLIGQGRSLALSGWGELFKIGLLQGGRLWQKIVKCSEKKSFKLNPGQDLWMLLPHAIAAKNRIVAKDPFEKNGLRHLLNLGHSFGHAIEINLNWPHGFAVAEGIHFSLLWSYEKSLISGKELMRLISVWGRIFGGLKTKKKMSKIELEKALKNDKKASSVTTLNFIFLRKVGQPLIKEVSVRSAVVEAQRQGYIR